MLKEYLSTLADAFRSKLGITGKINAQNFPDKVNEVYDKGKYDKWSEFWDNAAQGGTIWGNSYLFSTSFWNDKTFNPKYDIKFGYNGQVHAFAQCGITDMRGILERNGVKIIFGGGNFTNTFNTAKVTRLPEMTINPNNWYSIFYQCYYLKSIKKIKSTTTNPNYIGGSGMFYRCDALEEIEFDCPLFASISFQHSPLNKKTIDNVIGCLSGDVTGQTLTLKKSAVNTAFGIDVDDETTYTDEWKSLRDSKANWTFAYA